jgi:hypothetical protein
MKNQLLAILLTAASLGAQAGWERELSRLKGYTLIEVATVTGSVEKDGKRKDSFEGCEYGRKIIFDYNKTLTCRSYSYQYAYRPEAFIFVKNGDYIMLIDGDAHDMSNY